MKHGQFEALPQELEQELPLGLADEHTAGGLQRRKRQADYNLEEVEKAVLVA
ncbi:hypothetical protein D3C73_1344200 [compost metagenome]